MAGNQRFTGAAGGLFSERVLSKLRAAQVSNVCELKSKVLKCKRMQEILKTLP